MSCHFIYITSHSPTLLSLYLHHSSFSNPSVASPTSQFILQPFFASLLILQPFRHFTYVTTISQTLPSFYLHTAHSLTLPLLHLHHSSFSNPSFAFLTSQALHLMHLASLPCSYVTGSSLTSPCESSMPECLICQIDKRFAVFSAAQPAYSNGRM